MAHIVGLRQETYNRYLKDDGSCDRKAKGTNIA